VRARARTDVSPEAGTPRRVVSNYSEVTRQSLTDFDRNGREVHPRSNEPSTDARWWIVVALEIQYGPDAPVTEFVKGLWCDSLTGTQQGELL
jgi:hypothetical protein